MGDSLAFTILQLCAILAAVGLFASPSPDLLRIHRTGSIGEVSIVPLISLFGSGYIWSIYGFFMNDIFPVVITNGIGVFAATIYTSVYFYHTTEKRYVGKLLASVGLALAAVTLYSLLAVGGVTNQSHDDAGKIVGFLAVTVNIILFASPFESVVHIVRTKNASSLPITLCFVAMINCTLWVLYGIVDNDMFVLTPNALGLVFSIVQVGLYVKYRPGKQQLLGPSQADGDLSTVELVVDCGGSPKSDGMAFAKLKSPATGVEPLRASNV